MCTEYHKFNSIIFCVLFCCDTHYCPFFLLIFLLSYLCKTSCQEVSRWGIFDYFNHHIKIKKNPIQFVQVCLSKHRGLPVLDKIELKENDDGEPY